MCGCGKPTRNGEKGYSWDGKEKGVRQPWYPQLQEGDELLYDEPGRCGRRIDSHCFDVRIVRNGRGLNALVQNGRGDFRFGLLYVNQEDLDSLGSDGRYWLVVSMYHELERRERDTRQREHERFTRAYIQRRIRKVRNHAAIRILAE